MWPWKKVRGPAIAPPTPLIKATLTRETSQAMVEEMIGKMRVLMAEHDKEGKARCEQLLKLGVLARNMQREAADVEAGTSYNVGYARGLQSAAGRVYAILEPSGAGTGA